MNIPALTNIKFAEKISTTPEKTIPLSWGEYFTYLQTHRTKRLDEDVNIVIVNNNGTETSRRTTILKSTDVEGSAGYMAFCYRIGQRSGDLSLQNVRFACKHTGRPMSIHITPTVSSSTGLLKLLEKHYPMCVQQFVELMHRI